LDVDCGRPTQLPQRVGSVSGFAEQTNPADIPLITTDGFEFYERVIWQVFGQACIYGQIIKGHLELLRCYYNFVRPHRALKFGQDMRTPAMQAGLTGKRLTLREVFCSGIVLLTWCEIALRVRRLCPPLFSVENGALQVA
jgi:hypothetical protein